MRNRAFWIGLGLMVSLLALGSGWSVAAAPADAGVTAGVAGGAAGWVAQAEASAASQINARVTPNLRAFSRFTFIP